MSSGTTSVTCPVCEQPLGFIGTPGRTLSCDAGHRFDAAKQGYFNFLTGKGTNFLEDTSAMVQARDAFQAKGHYEPLALALSQLINSQHQGGSLDVLDAGAGTGYYLARILEHSPAAERDALALDISRYAMRRAAKVASTLAVVWDVWRKLPTADRSRDVVLNCFAPHNPAEFQRVLRPGGICIVVTGEPEHLNEVIEPLGMLSVAQGKQAALIEKFAAEGFLHLESTKLTYRMNLNADDLFQLAFMGPSGHHLSPELLHQQALELGDQAVTASFGVHAFVTQG